MQLIRLGTGHWCLQHGIWCWLHSAAPCQPCLATACGGCHASRDASCRGLRYVAGPPMPLRAPRLWVLVDAACCTYGGGGGLGYPPPRQRDRRPGVTHAASVTRRGVPLTHRTQKDVLLCHPIPMHIHSVKWLRIPSRLRHNSQS